MNAMQLICSYNNTPNIWPHLHCIVHVSAIFGTIMHCIYYAQTHNFEAPVYLHFTVDIYRGRSPTNIKLCLSPTVGIINCFKHSSSATKYTPSHHSSYYIARGTIESQSARIMYENRICISVVCVHKRDEKTFTDAYRQVQVILNTSVGHDSKYHWLHLASHITVLTEDNIHNVP